MGRWLQPSTVRCLFGLARNFGPLSLIRQVRMSEWDAMAESPGMQELMPCTPGKCLRHQNTARCIGVMLNCFNRWWHLQGHHPTITLHDYKHSLDNGRLNNRLLPSRRNQATSSIQKNINTPADQNIHGSTKPVFNQRLNTKSKSIRPSEESRALQGRSL
jgi:hypothetical protein